MRTRKYQIEGAFFNRIRQALKGAGNAIPVEVEDAIRSALKSAAMVGAIEERSRTLQILRARRDQGGVRAIEDEIISEGVLQVLGYEK